MKTQSSSPDLGKVKASIAKWEKLLREYNRILETLNGTTNTGFRQAYEGAAREARQKIAQLYAQLEPVYNEDEWV